MKLNCLYGDWLYVERVNFYFENKEQLNLTNFQAKERVSVKYLPTLIKIRVIYLAQYITHAVAEESKSHQYFCTAVL